MISGSYRKNILGIPLSVCTFQQAADCISGWVKEKSLHNTVIVANVHLITEAQNNTDLKAAFSVASLAVTDGMPLMWLAKKYNPAAERIVGVELMYALCKEGGRIFLLGGAEGVAEDLGKQLSSQYPVTIAGTACPPFRAWSAEEEGLLIAKINVMQPDILFVAFGAPKQELWMQKHRADLNIPVMIGVGAAFDYALGRLKRAPRWMQLAGLEWLYRLIQEPRRLLKRYAVSNMQFLWLVLRQYLNPRP